MRKTRFPSVFLLLLCGTILSCATAPHTTPAGVVAYENQTKTAMDAVKASNMSKRDKASVARTLQDGVAITKEQSAEIQRHEKREADLLELLDEKDAKIQELSSKAGRWDGLVYTLIGLGTVLLLVAGYMTYRWFKNRAIEKAKSLIP